jgi:hypothetical protein
MVVIIIIIIIWIILISKHFIDIELLLFGRYEILWGCLFVSQCAQDVVGWVVMGCRLGDFWV